MLAPKEIPRYYDESLAFRVSVVFGDLSGLISPKRCHRNNRKTPSVM